MVIGTFIYQIETSHLAHRDHEIAMNGGELPEEESEFAVPCLARAALGIDICIVLFPPTLTEPKYEYQQIVSRLLSVHWSSLPATQDDEVHCQRHFVEHALTQSPSSFQQRKKPFAWGMQSFFFNPKVNYAAEL